MFETARVSRPFLVLCLASVALLPLRAQTPAPAAGASGSTAPAPEQKKINWHKGPYTAMLGDHSVVAQIQVPEGYEFADGEGTRTFLEETGNPSNGSEIGVLQPIADDRKNDWWVLFEYDESGYVSDSEKGSIDKKKLLEGMQQGTEEDNAERKKRGWKPFHVTGWQTEPFYDDVKHNLTWATLGKTDDAKDRLTVNYTTRLLGRRGVIHVDLVSDPEMIDATLPRFKALMDGLAFTTGSRYSDFVAGDKVAEYGLTALIAGGATAVAVKTGLFAKLFAALAAMWKLIAVGFAALMTRIKSIWESIKKMFRGKGKSGPGSDLEPGA